MKQTKWTCERCKGKFNLGIGEGWVALAEEIPASDHGRLTQLEPYEKVCYKCADDLYAVVDKCNQDCMNCEATNIWGLSIRDCLQFQLKFDLLDLPQPQGQVPVMGSLYQAEDVRRVFGNF